MSTGTTEDGELDTLVIKNIADIEAAMKHGVEVLGPRIWQEVGKAVVEQCDQSTHHATADAEAEDVWLAQRSALLPESESADPDFWLGLDERTSLGGDGENSWLATFMGNGPNGATVALWVDQKIVGKPRWKKIVRSSDDLVEELRTAGFDVVEDDDRRLCIPLTLDADALAAAFRSDDFTIAMDPVRDAVRKAVAAAPLLERLRALALAAA